MSDVRTVYTATEVSDMTELTAAYVVRLARTLDLKDSEFRRAGRGGYLFSDRAVKKITQMKGGRHNGHFPARGDE